MTNETNKPQKIVTTIMLDPILQEKVDDLRKEHGFSSRSETINSVLLTYFKEGLETDNIMLSPSAILVPYDLYLKMSQKSSHLLQKFITENGIDKVTIQKQNFLVFEQSQADILINQISEYLPLNNRLNNIYNILEKISDKLEIETFNIEAVLKEYRETEEYSEALEHIYGKLTALMSKNYKKNKAFFIVNSSKEIIELCDPKYNDEKIVDLILPYIEFVIKMYKDLYWIKN